MERHERLSLSQRLPLMPLRFLLLLLLPSLLLPLLFPPAHLARLFLLLLRLLPLPDLSRSLHLL
jgi:hypothetical protein